MEAFFSFLIHIAWIIAIGFFIWKFKDSAFDLLSKRNVSLETKFGKLVIEDLEKQDKLTPLQRQELEGLTAHDIWALETFITANKPNKLASKVAAASFIDIGMIKKTEDKFVVTELGKKILEAADKII